MKTNEMRLPMNAMAMNEKQMMAVEGGARSKQQRLTAVAAAKKNQTLQCAKEVAGYVGPLVAMYATCGASAAYAGVGAAAYYVGGTHI